MKLNTYKILIFFLIVTLIIGLFLNFKIMNDFKEKNLFQNYNNLEIKQKCLNTKDVETLNICIYKKELFNIKEYYNLFNNNKNIDFKYYIQSQNFTIEYFLAYKECIKRKQCAITENDAVLKLIECAKKNTICAMYIYAEKEDSIINEIKNDSIALEQYRKNFIEIKKQYLKKYNKNLLL